jgi:hypothetical protein
LAFKVSPLGSPSLPSSLTKHFTSNKVQSAKPKLRYRTPYHSSITPQNLSKLRAALRAVQKTRRFDLAATSSSLHKYSRRQKETAKKIIDQV